MRVGQGITKSSMEISRVILAQQIRPPIGVVIAAGRWSAALAGRALSRLAWPQGHWVRSAAFFAGLKLGGARGEPQERRETASGSKVGRGEEGGPQGSATAREQLLAVVETYARAYQDAARMCAAELPVLPH